MKKYIVGLVALVTIASAALAPAAPAYADAATDTAQKNVCEGISGQVGGSCSGTGTTDISKTITVILNILSAIAGVAAVIMIIVGGLKYITSGGEAQAVSSAKRTLIYAVVGLVVVAFSQFIVHFVLINLKF